MSVFSRNNYVAEQVPGERRDLQGSHNGPAIRTIYSNYGASFGS